VPDQRRVLNLVTNPAVNTPADFEELASWVEALDPETAVYLLPDSAAAELEAKVPDLPTLTVSFAPARKLRPRRGPLLMGQHVAKSVEYAALEALGVPVPRWVRLLPAQQPDLSGFAEHVVTKPDFGARGADVRVERRDAVAWTPPRTELAERFGGPFNPRLVQEFVYTGQWPSSHRVATLFGTAVFGLRIEASHTRAALADRRSFHGQSVVSSGRGCSMSLSADPEVIALAERAHAAFPSVPLLGVDILREADTGRLFVIELNSIGYTWHFSSPSGLKLQAEFGLDLNAQLDGRRRAAASLAKACQARAR
jgi:ATP-grasp domain